VPTAAAAPMAVAVTFPALGALLLFVLAPLGVLLSLPLLDLGQQEVVEGLLAGADVTEALEHDRVMSVLK